MKCVKGYELQVCKSAAGYYVGTMDEDDCPQCRVSAYARTSGDAKDLPLDRDCVENNYYNKGNGCGFSINDTLNSITNKERKGISNGNNK